MAKNAAKATTVTAVTYHLDLARLSNEMRRSVEDITKAERIFTLRLLMSTFRDHYDAAKVSGFDGSGDYGGKLP